MTLASDLLNHAKQDFQDSPGTEEGPALHDVFPALLSMCAMNFTNMTEDVQALLQHHDAQLDSARGRPPEKLEVFKRSALILTVTAWEAFVEDAIRVALDQRLEKAKSPEDVENTFNAVAEKWLTAKKDRRPKPEHLMDWTENRWKDVISRQFRGELDRFHSPNSANIRSLSKTYLGFDITKSWTWKRVMARAACSRLDRLIQRRGELVHNSKDVFEAGGGATRSEVVRALALVKSLVECTQRALLPVCDN